MKMRTTLFGALECSRLTFSDKLSAKPSTLRVLPFLLFGRKKDLTHEPKKKKKQNQYGKKAAFVVIDAKTANSIVDWHSEKAN